jgi:hypothetical protein
LPIPQTIAAEKSAILAAGLWTIGPRVHSYL